MSMLFVKQKVKEKKKKKKEKITETPRFFCIVNGGTFGTGDAPALRDAKTAKKKRKGGKEGRKKGGK